ncbi:MAG: dihydropteroate synthase [Methyloprofundus sp.]|nr:dihydropteroate synthase [Methyloprofundus sp.]MBW6453623.1 dihydropteroate synthase [Methyloprofundus sp.]
MSEHILFLTGKLADKQLHQILEKMQPEFTYTVYQIGVKVAALMTADMIGRRLKDTFNADRILVPGRCRGDLEALSQRLNTPVERGPDELKDLPLYFGKQAHKIDLSHYAVKIFAEIVDAPNVSVDEVVKRAYYYKENGANVIDIGCLPDTPFAHMEEIIQTLKQEGFLVSIDSLETADLLRGAKAGADYMLSLHESTLWVADEVDAIPIIIPEKHTDLSSLDKVIALLQSKNKAFIVDPILDPVHFGFTDSVVRYHAVRQKYPDIEMMLGVGNITELTHADTAGMNALLLGMCSELDIKHILATEVSSHACRAIKEADLARRIMYAAKENNTLPKHIDAGLMALHETSPFPYSLAEIKEFAEQVKDPSFRIQISSEGVHIYNRDGLYSAIDPFDLYPKLKVEDDAGHAFYLGVELARAETAWQLGKRFNQDQALDWGCAVKVSEQSVDLHTFKPAGTTLTKS